MKSIQSFPPEKSGASSSKTRGHVTVFLAGSIEMGECHDWQQDIVNLFPDGVTFLNPRRPDWDSSQEQSASNPYVADQINWELDNLNVADIIFLYFDPTTKAPISLLELGIHLERKSNVIVCCPTGFYRKANIDITCKRYNVPVFEYFDTAVQWLEEYIEYRQAADPSLQ